MEEEILRGLNERQKKAVITTDGPVLIIAGAGAGKTKTITHRIVNLIHKGVNPAQILAITFTNKAAKEMGERVEKAIVANKSLNRPISLNERPFVSTFHALGVHIIKENAHRLGLTRYFSIYDRSDSKKAIKSAMETLGYDIKQYDPNSILSAISRQKGEGVSHVEYRDREHGYFQEIVANVWEKYEAILKKDKALDFDDLLLKTANLLRENKEVREYYQKVWTHIHIDEYQDTNNVQYVIAKNLVGPDENICVVGDSDQTIYTWRGAKIDNILNFEKDFPRAEVVLLEENYRSTQTILKAANNVIEKNIIRKKKTLFTKNIEGDKLKLIEAYTDKDEARMVADSINDLIREGVSPKEIAVLYRANFQSRLIEEMFLKKNIPYQVLGTKFFDRKEVRDTISFIRASLNPESTADITRIINVPPRGIGKVTLVKVLAGETASLGLSLRTKVGEFMKLLAKIKNVAEKSTPSELVKFVIKETGMESSLMTGNVEDSERIENLRELVSVASQYDEKALTEGRTAGIEAFLENAMLATDQDSMKENKDAVRMMTVHASKGLEFDHVYIIGMEEGLFPHEKWNDSSSDSGDGKGISGMSEAEAEEERRLFYVALTRARKSIVLSFANLRTIYGADKLSKISEFVNDIGHEHLDRHEIEEVTGVKAIFIDF